MEDELSSDVAEVELPVDVLVLAPMLVLVLVPGPLLISTLVDSESKTEPVGLKQPAARTPVSRMHSHARMVGL